MTQELLTQADLAIREGNKAKARSLLTHALQSNPRNAETWLRLSEVVDDSEHKRDCLKRALALAPNDLRIQEKLDLLDKAKASPTLGPEQTIPTEMRSPVFATRSIKQPVQTKERQRGYRNMMIAGVLTLGALIGVVLLVVTLGVIVPRGQKRLKPTPEPILYMGTLWCPQCETSSSFVILWEKVGDGISRGGQVGKLGHNTEVAILAEVWSGPEARTYFKVMADGQKGWVPENFVKK